MHVGVGVLVWVGVQFLEEMKPEEAIKAKERRPFDAESAQVLVTNVISDSSTLSLLFLHQLNVMTLWLNEWMAEDKEFPFSL